MDFTLDETHLLTHALAMGGWLSSGYFERAQERQQALIRLLAMQPPMFMRQVVTNAAKTRTGYIFRLTVEGEANARELKRVLTAARS